MEYFLFQKIVLGHKKKFLESNYTKKNLHARRKKGAREVDFTWAVG